MPRKIVNINWWQLGILFLIFIISLNEQYPLINYSLLVYLFSCMMCQIILPASWSWGIVGPVFAGMLLMVDKILFGGEALFFTFYVFGGLVIVTVFLIVNKIFMNIKVKKYQDTMMLLSDNKIYFDGKKLKSSQLSEQDIRFFKNTMNKYYKDYQYLQSVKDQMDNQFDLYDFDLSIIKAIFNELSESPRLLIEMNQFLYGHLQEYVSLVQKILDLQDNMIEDENDEKLLKDAFGDLRKLSKKFQQDFIEVTSDERKALEK